jgi:hypothetical protein
MAGLRNSMALLMGLMAQLYRDALVVLKPTSAFIAARKEIIGAGLPGELREAHVPAVGDLRRRAAISAP